MLDESTRQLALRMYTQGKDYEIIRARTGAARSTVRRWAAENGIPGRSTCKHTDVYPEAVRRKAVRLYIEGVKMRTISAKTGACQYAIRGWVSKAGHPLRSTHTNGRLDTAEVVALAKRVGPAAAARELGCVIGSVQYHVEKAQRERVRAELLAKGRR